MDKSQINLIHVIVAVMLIAGWFLFLIDKSAPGGIIATVGLLLEMVANLLK